MKITHFFIVLILVPLYSRAQTLNEDAFLTEIIDSFSVQNNNRLAIICSEPFSYSLAKESGLHEKIKCSIDKNVVIYNVAGAYCAAKPTRCMTMSEYKHANFNSLPVSRFRDSLDVLETRYNISNNDSDNAKLQEIYSSNEYKQFTIREIHETPIFLMVGTSDSANNKGFKYFWVDFGKDQRIHSDNGTRYLVTFRKMHNKWYIQKIEQYYRW